MDTTGAKLAQQAVAQADAFHLDEVNAYGCAETVYMTLKGILGLDDAADPSAAIALNGGIAYSGGTCGALTGAATTVGMLTERRLADHARAKRVALALVQKTMDAFEREDGTTNCRELIGYDLRAPGQHQMFIDSGLWRGACVAQIRMVVSHLAELADPDVWDDVVERVEVAPKE